MIKNRNLIKWPKTTFFSCFEAAYSFSEAASDSKMLKNDKKNRNLIKWPKTTFFSCFEAAYSFSEATKIRKITEN